MKQLIYALFTLTLLLTSVGTSSAQSLTDSLVLFLPMDGNVNDQSGNGFHAVTNGTLTTDRNGNPNSAYEFNGVNQTIDLPNVAQLKPQLPFSLSFYVRFDNNNCGIFTNDFVVGSYQGTFMAMNTNWKMNMNYGDGGSTGACCRRTKASSTVFSPNVWYHIVAVYRGATDMTMYVNCVDDGGTYSGNGGSMVYSNSPGKVGALDTGFGPVYLDGAIDHLAFWNRALGAQDIEDLCNGMLLNAVAADFSSEVYPNPMMGDNVMIETSMRSFSPLDLTVVDQTGKVVHRQSGVTERQTELDLKDLDSGSYFVQLRTEDGRSTTKVIRKVN